MCVTMRAEITLSISLDRNDKFETGLYFLNTCGSRPGFLIKGSYIADIQEEGNTLVDIQRLIICVMISIIVGR